MNVNDKTLYCKSGLKRCIKLDLLVYYLNGFIYEFSSIHCHVLSLLGNHKTISINDETDCIYTDVH